MYEVTGKQKIATSISLPVEDINFFKGEGISISKLTQELLKALRQKQFTLTLGDLMNGVKEEKVSV